jgi:8-oxo-dGTP diphosphatase
MPGSVAFSARFEGMHQGTDTMSTPAEIRIPGTDIPRSAAAEAWQGWVPHDRATLVFVVRGGEILLIRKKRGLGAGKINGPGGKLDPGETFLACAIREVEEELGVTPLEPEERGLLCFQFVDGDGGGGYGLEVRVFVATGCRGEPRETPEAIPLWTSLADIPYDEMWADDRVWLPLVLAGQRVRGRFVYDGDVMLDHALDAIADLAAGPAD